ncbi:SAV_915 family protein [Streptomyces sp. NPDC002403]
MNDNQRAEGPDPLQPDRAGTLFVPVRPGPAGCCARLFRTPLGARTAVAFTHERRLVRTLGQRQTWIRLSEPAIRALVAPLGVTGLVVDPQLAVLPVAGAPRAAGTPQLSLARTA